jgi:hypothetical protein
VLSIQHTIYKPSQGKRTLLYIAVCKDSHTVTRLFLVHFKLLVDRVAQSVKRLVTGWMVRGSNPDGRRDFRICLDRPWGPPSLLYKGCWVIPGCRKRPGRDAVPSAPSSVEV